MATHTKANVADFIRGLTSLYPLKFLRMHDSAMSEGVPDPIWIKAVGGYPQAAAQQVLSDILDDRTKFSDACPSLPQIRGLLNKAVMKMADEKREAIRTTKKIDQDKLQICKSKPIRGVPQGFGRYQPSVDELHKSLAPGVLDEATKLKGRDYAMFMMNALGCVGFFNKVRNAT